MKILFLHLSDLHLKNAEGASPIKIQSAVQTLSVLGSFEGAVVIISGDIAASGTENEYKIGSLFLGRLIDEIEKKHSITKKNMKILLVPGNHDINYGIGVRPLPEAIRNFSIEERKDSLNQEINRMIDYFSFSSRNRCFFSVNENDSVRYSQLFTRKILHFDNNYMIEANLVNSAPFSCDADDGLHYLPEDSMLQISKASDANFAILIMHHSTDWFSFSNKKYLQKIIAQRCSIVFYGHEHIIGTQQIVYNSGDRILQQAGGAWWQQSAPTVSNFYAAIFNSDNCEYSLSAFNWNPSTMRFDPSFQHKETLNHKSLNGYTLEYREGYLSDLMIDNKHSISENISDYFVFPDLKCNMSKEYANGISIRKMEDLVKYIKENKYVAITGGSDSGKTMLSKMLFKTLHRDMTVIYCGTEDITGRKHVNIIKELVQDTYGESSYPSFLELSTTYKAIIIDDLHRIAPKHLDKFLHGIENEFDIIVVATAETTRFDIIEMVKENISSKREFKKLSIMRFYADKRLEVISKIVSLKSSGNESSKINTARVLEQSLNTYKLSFRAEVDFVVQFADYYCTHIGELTKSDATVFSKVFEASIERAITPNIGRYENTNDIIVALSEIAHSVHFSHEYPISVEHIKPVIEYYCQYYDNRYLTTDRLIEIAEQSSLLIKASSGFQYRFKSKDHLAYFVAKALNRKFNDNGYTNDLKIVVEQSCFGINGDILMFLTYITENVNIPRLLLAQALTYTQTWSEFKLSDKKIKYLVSVPENKLSAPDDNQKEDELDDQARVEELTDSEIETLDIYDYDISKLDELNYQLIRAFLQLRILARSLSAFISLLPATDKQNLVLAMYQLPNKIFSQWAESIDNNIHSLIEDILDWQNNEDLEGKKLSRKDIARFFQEVSINMLLNLYYLVALHGVNNSTVDYLSQQGYVSDSMNYQLERLMFYEKVDDYQSAIKEAEKMYDSNSDGMVKNMILSILRHTIIHSDQITDRERRRISDKYFSATKTSLLLERQKVLSTNKI